MKGGTLDSNSKKLSLVTTSGLRFTRHSPASPCLDIPFFKFLKLALLCLHFFVLRAPTGLAEEQVKPTKALVGAAGRGIHAARSG